MWKCQNLGHSVASRLVNGLELLTGTVNGDGLAVSARTAVPGPARSLNLVQICTQTRARRKRQTKGHLQVDRLVALPSLVSTGFWFAVSIAERHKQK
jgi:hypothetical protein